MRLAILDQLMKAVLLIALSFLDIIVKIISIRHVLLNVVMELFREFNFAIWEYSSILLDMVVLKIVLLIEDFSVQLHLI